MSYRIAPAVLLALVVASGSISRTESDVPAGEEEGPLDSDLVERTERRLVQLDLSLSPRKKRGGGALPQLNLEDLELVIAGERIDIRHVDRLCKVEESGHAPETQIATTVAPTSPNHLERSPDEIPTRRGAYLFYFEHSHLTMEGQENALVMAEEMIPRLVRRGARGMVVSSGRKLLQSKLTDSPDELLDFLHAVRHNPLQWSEVAYAEGEWNRYADIFGTQTFESGLVPTPDRPRGGASSESTRGLLSSANLLAGGLASGAGSTMDPSMKTVFGRSQRRALMYAREEYMRTNRQLRRFAAVLGCFAELDPPKAALYFADIIRKNAGRHYAQLFASSDISDSGYALSAIEMSAAMAAFAFDAVTRQAATHGIRLYTIRARGLDLGVSNMVRSRYARPNQLPMPDRGQRDADETMVAFALESGGASFRGGTESSTINKVLDRMRADLSCFYLLSFYPDGLPVDSLLPVRVRFNVDSPRHDELNRSWDLRTRGQLVVQSEARRKEAILLAAHTSPSSVDSNVGRSVLIPLGFTEDSYQVLAQFAVDVPGLPEELSPSISWDLGMSLLYKDKVRDHVARQIEVGATGAPAVLEAVWSLPPGPTEVVSVGYEHHFGQLASVGQNSDWPDPDGAVASITPIAVVQPAEGAFVRVDPDDDEQPRTAGPLGIGDQAARLDLPIYFVALVCRDKRNRDLWIDRKLVGDVAVDFELQNWSASDAGHCVQIRDLIRPGQAGWGEFRYVVRVYGEERLEGEPLAEREREFVGLEGGAG